MVLYIDHYDSFTNIIVDYVTYLGFEVSIKKTDEKIANIEQYSHIIIGPGPGHPNELKDKYQIIKFCEENNKPLLGICLGHQLVAQYYGSKIIKSQQIYHGRNSVVTHTGSSALYKNIPKQFEVTRYHSLIIDEINLPLINIAMTKDSNIMAFQHQKLNIFGVQYHPEAYMTENGLDILRNFLTL